MSNHPYPLTFLSVVGYLLDLLYYKTEIKFILQLVLFFYVELRTKLLKSSNFIYRVAIQVNSRPTAHAFDLV